MQKTLSVINLSAIRHNARYVRSLIGNRFFWAVVKADGYGHGAAEVARELSDIADGFCVALSDEGAELRINGITKPVLVLAPPLNYEDVEKLRYYNLTPTVTDGRSARLIGDGACHIAVNTGMNRYGCCGKELERMLEIIPRGNIAGVYSHLYAAENALHSKKQLSAFRYAAAVVKAHSPDAVAHLSASGGILKGADFLCEGVRCGLMLYGYAPVGFKCKALMPALKVYAHLSGETHVTGGGVGYNIADRGYSRLYTYRLGYADGFWRGVPLGEKTLCMDAFISTKRQELLPVFTDAESYAKKCGTISYEVLCSVTKRSQRIYERTAEIQI
ncbi:MAG: alanine racemase [Clostridia bacterium]|nr:alanine racemase [Clostridia bacterium]